MQTKMRVLALTRSQLLSVELSDPPEYHELVELLEPHLHTPLIERVRVFWGVRGEPPCYLDMFVDESGRRKKLPRNEAATRIYRNNVLVHEPERYEYPELLPAIYGPAVLFYDRVWF
jgi:hypothetical protein